jgi:surfactin synthase thioesterase subunit
VFAAERAAGSWLRRLGTGEGTSRLVCLPYAGGSGSSYEDWTRWLPDEVELWVPDLPAREHRMLEKPVEDLGVLVEALADTACVDGRPVSLFGHSFGALVAFELARRLRDRSRPVLGLFVSGMAAPQTLARRRTPTDEEILFDLRSQGVAPPELYDQPDLLELVMPGIRADYAMALGYRYREAPPLTTPVFALGGTADHGVPAAALAAWAAQTRASCETRMWDGDHMYLRDRAAELSGFVAKRHLRLTGG